MPVGNGPLVGNFLRANQLSTIIGCCSGCYELLGLLDSWFATELNSQESTYLGYFLCVIFGSSNCSK